MNNIDVDLVLFSELWVWADPQLTTKPDGGDMEEIYLGNRCRGLGVRPCGSDTLQITLGGVLIWEVEELEGGIDNVKRVTFPCGLKGSLDINKIMFNL